MQVPASPQCPWSPQSSVHCCAEQAPLSPPQPGTHSHTPSVHKPWPAQGSPFGPAAQDLALQSPFSKPASHLQVPVVVSQVPWPLQRPPSPQVVPARVASTFLF
jgi:hypothetical protein